MTKKIYTELQVGDTFKMEYGCFNNWVTCTLISIDGNHAFADFGNGKYSDFYFCTNEKIYI